MHHPIQNTKEGPEFGQKVLIFGKYIYSCQRHEKWQRAFVHILHLAKCAYKHLAYDVWNL